MKNNYENIKLDAIKQIYKHKDTLNGMEISKPRLTKKGHFYQSNLNYISNGIFKLIEDDVVNISKPFFDAGAGDARVIAVTSIVFNIPSYGLEFDAEVVEDGLVKIENLNRANLIKNETPLVFKQGDFTDDEYYKTLNLKFEDIGTFFNFDNGFKDIANKIKNQSLPGTIFLFMRIIPRVESFAGLKFLTQVNLSINNESRYNLCVYQKMD